LGNVRPRQGGCTPSHNLSGELVVIMVSAAPDAASPTTEGPCRGGVGEGLRRSPTWGAGSSWTG